MWFDSLFTGSLWDPNITACKKDEKTVEVNFTTSPLGNKYMAVIQNNFSTATSLLEVFFHFLNTTPSSTSSFPCFAEEKHVHSRIPRKGSPLRGHRQNCPLSKCAGWFWLIRQRKTSPWGHHWKCPCESKLNTGRGSEVWNESAFIESNELKVILGRVVSSLAVIDLLTHMAPNYWFCLSYRHGAN